MGPLIQPYQALVSSLGRSWQASPVGSAAFEPQLNAKGERLNWIEESWRNKLDAMRGPGESYSAVILRLTAAEDRQGDDR